MVRATITWGVCEGNSFLSRNAQTANKALPTMPSKSNTLFWTIHCHTRDILDVLYSK
jgi:hypothetical protein